MLIRAPRRPQGFAMLALAAKRLRDLFRAFAARGRFTSPLVLTVLAEPLWRLAARRRRAAPGGLSWRKSAPNVAASDRNSANPLRSTDDAAATLWCLSRPSSSPRRASDVAVQTRS